MGGRFLRRCKLMSWFVLLALICLVTIFWLSLLKEALPRGRFQNANKISPECLCVYKNRDYDLCYRSPSNDSIVGSRFRCELLAYLDDIGLLNTSISFVGEADSFNDTAFVTTFSSNHFSEGLMMIKQFQSAFPDRTIHVYDLGLKKSEEETLRNLQHVDYRKFHFERFPESFRKLKGYRFKSIVHSLFATEFKSFFFMDASVRWCSAAGLEEIAKVFECHKRASACEWSPIMPLITSTHGIAFATHPGMYTYLATDRSKAAKTEMLGSGFLYFARTADTVEVLKWFTLCALEETCMDPPGSNIVCVSGKDRFTSESTCHRYDQSALNILLANRFDYDTVRYRGWLNGTAIERSSRNGCPK